MTVIRLNWTETGSDTSQCTLPSKIFGVITTVLVIFLAYRYHFKVKLVWLFNVIIFHAHHLITVWENELHRMYILLTLWPSAIIKAIKISIQLWKSMVPLIMAGKKIVRKKSLHVLSSARDFDPQDSWPIGTHYWLHRPTMFLTKIKNHTLAFIEYIMPLITVQASP